MVCKERQSSAATAFALGKMCRVAFCFKSSKIFKNMQDGRILLWWPSIFQFSFYVLLQGVRVNKKKWYIFSFDLKDLEWRGQNVNYCRKHAWVTCSGVSFYLMAGEIAFWFSSIMMKYYLGDMREGIMPCHASMHYWDEHLNTITQRMVSIKWWLTSVQG